MTSWAKLFPDNPKPTRQDKPALLADGEMDNACRPLYIDLIHHYFPNSQRVLFTNRAHGVNSEDWRRLMQQFLDTPLKKLESDKKEIIVY